MDIKEKILKFLHLDGFIDNLMGYVEARLELYKLEIREDIAKLISKTIVYVAILFFGFLLLLFFSIGLAYFINRFFAETYIGFWIVAGVYGIAFLILLLFKKSLDKTFEKHFLEIIKRKQK